LNISLPEPGHYATGLFFIQNNEQQVQLSNIMNGCNAGKQFYVQGLATVKNSVLR
jgi:hypothetical protein